MRGACSGPVPSVPIAGVSGCTIRASALMNARTAPWPRPHLPALSPRPLPRKTIFDFCCTRRGACVATTWVCIGLKGAHVPGASTHGNTTTPDPPCPLPHSLSSPKHHIGQIWHQSSFGGRGMGRQVGTQRLPSALFAELRPPAESPQTTLSRHWFLVLP